MLEFSPFSMKLFADVASVGSDSCQVNTTKRSEIVQGGLKSLPLHV